MTRHLVVHKSPLYLEDVFGLNPAERGTLSAIDEPFGIVALEGMAAGAAVVSSDAGGLRDARAADGVSDRGGARRTALLRERGYHFTTVTPATHGRVLSRAATPTCGLRGARTVTDYRLRPIANTLLVVRTNIAPPARAGVALPGSVAA